MVKKYSVLITIVIFLILLLTAVIVYPGGSYFNKNSIGFDWKENFITNLFDAKALNGLDNPARPWAIAGITFFSISFGNFYYYFSEKIASSQGKFIIKYAGITSMIFAFLIVTPYHDIMVTCTDILSLLTLFYITVFVFKTKLFFHKVICSICIFTLYLITYIYYSGVLLFILPTL